MKVYIYNWELRQKDPKVIIIAHALTSENQYISITIDTFKPYCFISETDKYKVKNFCECVEMTLKSSNNINEESTYYRVSFYNYSDMMSSCRYIGWMTDFNLLTMFLSQEKYRYTGWFETSPKLRLLDEVKATNPKVCSFDIECMPLSNMGMPKPYMRSDSIQMISFVFWRHPGGPPAKYLVYIGYKNEISIEDCNCVDCSTEEELIALFGEIIQYEDPDVITGYNIFGFDFDYILKRCKIRLVPLPELSRNGITDTYYVSWSSSAYGENFYSRIEASGRIFIDMILFFSRKTHNSISLGNISQEYLGENKDEVSHSKVWKDRSLIQDYAKYCVKDSVLVMKLFDMFDMWTDSNEKSRSMMCSIEDIYTRGEQMKIINQVVYSCISRGIVLKKIIQQDSWNTLKGASVFDPVTNLYSKCSVIDFASMYPSIIIKDNICPSTYVGNNKFSNKEIGIIPLIAKHLLSERKKVKEQMKESTGSIKKILHSRQNALKICANAIYGSLGVKTNEYLGSYPCSSHVTQVGRQMLEFSRLHVNSKYNAEVIYGDTDSCMIRFLDDLSKDECISLTYDICKDINKQLPPPMAINFEEYYDKVLLVTKKRYITWKDGEIKYKGVAVVRNNYCVYVKKCYEHIAELIGKDASKDEILDYITWSMVNLAEGCVDNEDLKLTKSVKPLDTYKTQSTPQYLMAKRLETEGMDWESRLEYVFTTYQHPNGSKSQGYKMFTLDEVNDKGLSIDYMYYVDKQLTNVFGDFAEVFGFGSEIIEMNIALKSLY